MKIPYQQQWKVSVNTEKKITVFQNLNTSNTLTQMLTATSLKIVYFLDTPNISPSDADNASKLLVITQTVHTSGELFQNAAPRIDCHVRYTHRNRHPVK